APLGLGDELRTVFRSGSTCWGLLCLHRALGSPSFSAEEAGSLAALAPAIGEGLRTALLTGAVARQDPEGPGLIVIDANLSLAAISPVAEAWLAEIGETDWQASHELPDVVLGVAGRLRGTEMGEPG